MTDFDPDEFLSKSEVSSSDFDPDAFLGEQAPSEAESALRGAAQGASFDLADEISGGAEALFNKVGGDPVAFGELYKKYRDESREKFKAAQEANPKSYAAGQIGGSIASAALIPGGSAATLAKAAKTGAAYGALSGFGSSESDSASGLAKDVAVGAGLGAAGGALAKGAERAMGASKNLVRGASDKITDTATSAGSVENLNSLLPKPSDDKLIFKEAAQSAKNRLKSFFNPEIDPDFKGYAEIAKKHGIDPNDLPESIKFGPDSSASRASRSLAEGRFGEETLKRFNANLGKVRDAYDNKIASYSKGVPVDELTAGKVLRESYDDGVSKFFDKMDFTHNTIVDQVPGLQINKKSMEKINSSLAGVENFAKGRLARGVTDTQRKQGQQLLNAVAAIRNGNGSYKQTVEALRDIGEAAFQSKNSLADVPVDVAKMRKIYGDLNDSLISTVRQNLGDDIADRLVSNNKEMTEFFGDKSLISQIMGDKSVAPEKAFRALVLSGDSKKIESLKKILPAEKWEYLKGAVLENLVKRDPEGNFTFKQLHNAMRGKKSGLTTMFSPDELADASDIIRLGDRFGSPILSSSGTGASISFQDIYKVPTDLSVNALAIRNANKAAQRALNPVPKKAGRVFQKALPAKVGGSLGGSSASDQNYAHGGLVKKGFDKWADDGEKSLKKSGVSEEQISDMKKSKSGKQMLIDAAALKHGSKGHKSLVDKIQKMYRGGMVKNYEHGGMVDGDEVVSGDSEKNDIVSAKLSAGEIVIPKSLVLDGSDDEILLFIKNARKDLPNLRKKGAYANN